MADRRIRRDRRRWRLRNRRHRQGDQPVIVLELTSTDVHVLELRKRPPGQGGDELCASAFRWRQSPSALYSSDGVAGLTAAFRELARQHDLHGVEIRLVISGEFCVLRTLRGTSDEVQKELQQLEQRSRLYLSLGVGEKVLVSSGWAIDARHAHATAAVCNQATLDAIQSASEAAGIELTAIEPALCALSRAAQRLPETPAGSYLLVNVNPSGMEVGVCHEGQLLLDYRPGGRTASAQLLPTLESHLNRLSRHVGRCLRISPPKIKDVYLCGDESSVRDAAKLLKRQQTLKVHEIRPADVRATWQLGDGGPGFSTAALGAMLAAYLPEAEQGVPNLMQHIIECKREPLRPVLLRCATPLAATLLVAATFSIINSRLQAELDVMQTELDGLAVAQARATELRLQLIGSKGKLAELEKLAAQLPAEVGDELVSDVAACMPSDVWLSQLEIADLRTARLRGASYLEAGVYDFVRWLEQAPVMNEVALKGTSPSTSVNGPITNFELELSLSPDLGKGPRRKSDPPSNVDLAASPSPDVSLASAISVTPAN